MLLTPPIIQLNLTYARNPNIAWERRDPKQPDRWTFHSRNKCFPSPRSLTDCLTQNQKEGRVGRVSPGQKQESVQALTPRLLAPYAFPNCNHRRNIVVPCRYHPRHQSQRKKNLSKNCVCFCRQWPNKTNHLYHLDRHRIPVYLFDHKCNHLKLTFLWGKKFV